MGKRKRIVESLGVEVKEVKSKKDIMQSREFQAILLGDNRG